MRVLLNISLSMVALLLFSCTEPFTIETIDFNTVLIVEGRITDELKHHSIKLSRSTQLEDAKVQLEHQAQVHIEASNGQMYPFTQDDATGHYISTVAFQAEPHIDYTLTINTQDGGNYQSTAVHLPPTAEIDSVYAEPMVLDGLEGVMVFVDSQEGAEETPYLRYEYEATYKIKVPKPSDWEWEVIDYDFISGYYEINLTHREPETICYSNYKSFGILQALTAEFTQGHVMRYPLHYLYKGAPALRERYSILVKQYVQSIEAHTFYRTLHDLGMSESLLSQGQPGFVPGNIQSTTHPNEKVLGFFEASTVSSKRIYFNYKDFGFAFPPYFEDCTRLEVFPTAALITKLERQDYQIQDFEEDGPVKLYHLYKEACTDCTTFSSNVKPDFWVD